MRKQEEEENKMAEDIKKTIRDIEDKVEGKTITIDLKEAPKKDEWPDISVIKDWTLNDPLKLSAQDPEFAYRWLRDDHKNIATKTASHLSGLWKIVPKEHIDALEKRFNVKIHRAPDGLIRYGDLILGYIPKNIYGHKQKIKAERAKAPMAEIDKMLKEGASPSELQGIHSSLEGIKTEKQLGMK